MATINDNYLKLPGSYLFAEIGRRVAAYKEAHPEADIIRLGIGDVTQPLPPACLKAMHEAVDEMGSAETFRGYGPEQGYTFLTEAILKNNYEPYGLHFGTDEIFVSDGSKSDCGNIQEIFGLTDKVAGHQCHGRAHRHSPVRRPLRGRHLPALHSREQLRP